MLLQSLAKSSLHLMRRLDRLRLDRLVGEVTISAGIYRDFGRKRFYSQTMQQNVFMHLLLNVFEMVSLWILLFFHHKNYGSDGKCVCKYSREGGERKGMQGCGGGEKTAEAVFLVRKF